VALALTALVLPAPPAVAQAAPPAVSDAITPVEEYARQVEQLKKSYPDLAKRIEDTAKTIDEVTEVDRARKEIEELRAIVANMLGAVSDNGTVSQLGAKALTHARAKLRQLEQEARFKPEERAFLVDLWRKLITETEHASDELDTARKEFAELLRTLQTREDFIDELMQVRRAAEAIRVIRELTKEIRSASDKLKTLINGIKPPGV
jgi:DNA repair exonuclease SbcCD ATPase subunit